MEYQSWTTLILLGLKFFAILSVAQRMPKQLPYSTYLYPHQMPLVQSTRYNHPLAVLNRGNVPYSTAPLYHMQEKEKKQWVHNLPQRLQPFFTTGENVVPSLVNSMPLSSSGQYFRIPFAVSSQHHANIWNYDVDSWKAAQNRDSPLAGFNRGGVETSGKSESQGKPGFTRGQIESVPTHKEVAGSRGNDHKVIQAYSEPSKDKKVVCSFASWAWYRKGKASFLPENVDPTLCTHLIYAFAKLNKATFTITESDPFTDKENGKNICC